MHIAKPVAPSRAASFDRSFAAMRCAIWGLLGAVLYLFAHPAPAQLLSAGIDGSFPAVRRAAPLSANEVQALHPQDLFKECGHCPEMVVVGAGEFVMGAPEDEPGSTPDERPQHKVTIAQPFGVGRFSVTAGEWDACVQAKGCTYRPSDPGQGGENRPVAGITFEDAGQYVRWLSRTTARTYRLLSEAEREYVARAGTITAFWWGDSLAPAHDAGPGGTSGLTAGPASPSPLLRTAAAQTSGPNPWGLYQVHGDVYDWVEDCWNENYDGAPADGSAWTSGDCDRHVLRGGASGRSAQTMRSAARIWFGSPHRLRYMSLRVARTLR